MTIVLDNAPVYDIETFPNVFTFAMKILNGEQHGLWEISRFRDDREQLMIFFNYLIQTQTPMIGFNNLAFDYPVIHYLFNNPNATVEQLYEFAMHIINSQGQQRFANMIWADNRFAPQIDVFKINHFDNMAKSTSLKALQINMRSENVVESSVPFGTVLTHEQTELEIKPYNVHDVDKTEQFANFCMDAINFRLSLIEQFGVDVLNWNDTKIGSKMMEEKLGKELCFDYSSGRKQMRQSPRAEIALNDIIFPYVTFENPEFNRVLAYLKQQVLKADEVAQFNETPSIKTKGVFNGLKANVGGMDFCFGTGGIHGSVEKQRIIATDEWLIRDIDVASLYPSIAIVNRLAPEHLGETFAQKYAELPLERKRWQAEKGKKCVEANALKLASNGVYGNSNNKYSVFYDPKYTMTITVNGQLLLCMLAEWLLKVPTIKLIQINTDGITYMIHHTHEPHAAAICKEWEALTALVLEGEDYSRMFIRDVNNYIAEDMKGGLKLKGAYWSPDALDYHNSISQAQPPAWHKDLGNCVSTRAAVAHMIHGVDPETYIRLNNNPYDFMCIQKTKRSDILLHGGLAVQKTSRYYISTAGAPLTKQAPPKGVEGHPKKANGVSDAEYARVMTETGNQWDARVCTKNKSVYATRITNLQAGFMTTLCNHVDDFDFSTVNYDWYVQEAKKLIV